MFDIFILQRIRKQDLIPHFRKLYKLIKNKIGFEIGGPSLIFGEDGPMPIYPFVKRVDCCSFSIETIWEGKVQEGRHFEYMKHREKGYRYMSDATDLAQIKGSQYDFVLASHCLEHIANPLKALEEWLRIINRKGSIVLVLPDRRFTFDHKRQTTTLEHLVEDYKNNIKEDDLTHLDEILQLHDLSLDLPAGNVKQFEERSLKNFENRCLHHHVFDEGLIQNIANYFNIDLLFCDFREPYHIVAVLKKR